MAITWWPALRTRRARDFPNPAEQPVMSKTRDLESGVDAILVLDPMSRSR